jgi:hypothetical protein
LPDTSLVTFPRNFERNAQINGPRAKGWQDSMKSKTSLDLVEEARRREVEHEILSYFLAVESYPARAAREPQVSFEAHCWSVYTVLENGQAN